MPESAVPDALKDLRAHLAPIADLRATAAILRWDQETYMPAAGAAGRAEQLATLTRLAHNLFVSPRMRDLLMAAEAIQDRLDPSSDEAGLIRMTRRDFERASRLPAEFVAAKARAASLGTEIWRDARRRNDFAAFRPALHDMVEFARREADYIGFQDHPYDALLDQYEPGMTSRETDRLFERLRDFLVPFVRAIGARGRPAESQFLHQDFDPAEQRVFGLKVAEAFGYDLSRGRLDESAHPFETSFHRDDVRITTRYQRNFLPTALFAIFHETGHALYEQGISPSLARTGIDHGASMGLHESQSRLWENLVGRSRPFLQHYYPILQQHFPQLRRVDQEMFYRAVNRVYPSLIRVEADEVTYNLHIILRYELEKRLLEGGLAVKDLPHAWEEEMRRYLGVVPSTDADGVMQDTHWSGGSFGYFPTYTLGNIISVQLFEAARRAHPTLLDGLAGGEFGTLLVWLRQNVHQHGRKFLPKDILRKATGAEVTPEPYLGYLHQKFSEIYGVTPEAPVRRSL